MRIPDYIIANADDLGLNPSVNDAIARCYELGYINSSSLLTNTEYFNETVSLIHASSFITHIGVHINLAEGKPVTNFNIPGWLDENGEWNLAKTNKKAALPDKNALPALQKEIDAQIEKALSAHVAVTHLDSHYHLHTLPQFYNLFINAARKHKLKLRLAQTYNEGNYLNFLYRTYINNSFKTANINYSDYFETVEYFLGKKKNAAEKKTTELMFHPGMDAAGNLTDTYRTDTLFKWVGYLTDGD